MSEMMRITDIKREIEMEEEFCAVTESIKSEEKWSVLPDNYDPQKTENNSEFSDLTSQSDGNISLLSRCRLCTFPNNDMIDIFTSNGTENKIAEKLEQCLGVVVRESDPLPKQVCLFCLQQLELCYNFKETVAEAEKHLFALYKQTSGKLEETERNDQPCSAPNVHCDATDHRNIESTLQQASDVEVKTNGSSTIECFLCQKTFNGYRELKRHKTVHLKNGNYHCSICDKVLHTESKMKLHVIVHTRERAWQCDYCGKRLKLKKNLQSHFRCCKKRPDVKEGLHDLRAVHKQTSGKLEEIERNDQPCSAPNVHCDAMDHRNIESTLQQASDVEVKTNGSSTFECFLCQKTFNGYMELKRHKTVHSKNGDYHCSICDKVFHSESTMKIHALVHTHERPWQCDYCERRYQVKYNLQLHFSRCKKRPDVKGGLYDRRALYKQTFRKLEDTERNDQPCSAPNVHCDATDHRNIESTLQQASDVKIKTNGSSTIECFLCQKTLNGYRDLIRHKTNHSKNGDYHCSICDRVFRSESRMKTHAIVHTGERLWQCDCCEKRYKAKCNLQRHFRSCKKRRDVNRVSSDREILENLEISGNSV